MVERFLDKKGRSILKLQNRIDRLRPVLIVLQEAVDHLLPTFTPIKDEAFEKGRYEGTGQMNSQEGF